MLSSLNHKSDVVTDSFSTLLEQCICVSVCVSVSVCVCVCVFHFKKFIYVESWLKWRRQIFGVIICDIKLVF